MEGGRALPKARSRAGDLGPSTASHFLALACGPGAAIARPPGLLPLGGGVGEVGAGLAFVLRPAGGRLAGRLALVSRGAAEGSPASVRLAPHLSPHGQARRLLVPSSSRRDVFSLCLSLSFLALSKTVCLLACYEKSSPRPGRSNRLTVASPAWRLRGRCSPCRQAGVCRGICRLSSGRPTHVPAFN